MSCEARIVAMAKRVTQALCYLADPVANITVERIYSPNWLNPDLWLSNPDLLDRFTGRRVYVLPVSERHEGPVSRKHDDNRIGTGVIVVEKYTGAEVEVPVEWIDERLGWIEAKVLDYLGDARHPVVPGADPMTQEWVSVYQPDLLRQHKVLRSEVLVSFRVIAPGPGMEG